MIPSTPWNRCDQHFLWWRGDGGCPTCWWGRYTHDLARRIAAALDDMEFDDSAAPDLGALDSSYRTRAEEIIRDLLPGPTAQSTDAQLADTLRIMDLEDGISQAQHTIEFLRDCLNGHATHEYPEQTERRLEKLHALYPSPPTCHHSRRSPESCESCRAHMERAERRATIIQTLSQRSSK